MRFYQWEDRIEWIIKNIFQGLSMFLFQLIELISIK